MFSSDEAHPTSSIFSNLNHFDRLSFNDQFCLSTLPDASIGSALVSQKLSFGFESANLGVDLPICLAACAFWSNNRQRARVESRGRFTVILNNLTGLSALNNNG